MKLPSLTKTDRAEYDDFVAEVPLVIPAECRREAMDMVMAQRELFLSPLAWREWEPVSDIHLTWVGEIVEDIQQLGGMAWVQEKVANEDYTHRLKTPRRMEEVAKVRGLSRILLTALVRCRWVHPRLKLLWFVLCWDEREDEYPHAEECIVEGDDEEVLVNVFRG